MISVATISDISSRLALDAQSLGQLRLQAKTDPVAGARPAAQQFEALFLGMMLKSMRDATPQDGLFDDSTTQLYTSMLDSQLAQTLSKGRGIGLADMMLRQMQAQGVIPKVTPDIVSKVPVDRGLGGNVGRQLLPLKVKSTPPPTVSTPMNDSQSEGVAEVQVLQEDVAKTGFADAADFANTLWPHAADVGNALGVPARFLIAQAALESGWGKREIRDAQGNNSYNLFGIKAGKSWHGAVAEAVTTEYVNGVARKKTERFRAYDSYADSFKDYASLLKNSPRYGSVLAKNDLDAAKFARGLQQAGYATDPMYADKLVRVINSSALRQAIS